MATIWGISVMATVLPLNQATDAPSKSATTARIMFTGRCGLAAGSTVKTARKLARIATSIPKPATRMPEGAETGEDMRFSPYMKRKAAARSAAPVIK